MMARPSLAAGTQRQSTADIALHSAVTHMTIQSYSYTAHGNLFRLL